MRNKYPKPKKLRILMIRKDLKKQDIANVLQKSVSTVGQKLSGYIELGLSDCRKIANYYNIPIDDVID